MSGLMAGLSFLVGFSWGFGVSRRTWRIGSGFTDGIGAETRGTVGTGAAATVDCGTFTAVCLGCEAQPAKMMKTITLKIRWNMMARRM